MYFSENRATEFMGQQHRRIGSRYDCHRESKIINVPKIIDIHKEGASSS